MREVTALVEKLLKDVVVHDQSPVIQLFSKRLYRVLYRACIGQPFAHTLAAYSLQSKAQERNMATMITMATQLCQHTLAVHGEVYTEIIRTLAQKLLVISANNNNNIVDNNNETIEK